MAGISDIRHELCLALALWNGERPDPEGADVRPHGAAGQPRRGRQGVLVVPRGAAEPRAPALALPLPAGRVPLRAARRTTAAASTTRSSSCSTPACSTTTATGRSTSPTRRPRRPRCWCGSSSRTTGPTRRPCDVLPTLWFRNTWSWGDEAERPRIAGDGSALVVSEHALAGYRLEAAPGPDGAAPEALFCENETNAPARLRVASRRRRIRRTGSTTTSSPAPPRQPGRVRHEGRAALPRDGARRRQGRAAAPAPPALGEGEAVGLGRRRRSTRSSPPARRTPTSSTPRSRLPGTTPETMRVLRQACAGLVWSKQMYPYNVRRWLDGDPGEPPPPEAHRHGRNSGWRHLDAFDVLAMPDPWEYPWFAAWDLGFHCGRLGAPRSGLREVPAPRPAARVVPAPERRAARLRVELRRRQPAGARDGRAPRVPHRRRPGPRVPRADLPEAAAQLHLVAQPAGRRRQQRLQRRLPRARQHQPDRPLQPARRASRSSRPTARPGWPTTRSRCSSSRSSWRRRTTSTWTW